MNKLKKVFNLFLLISLLFIVVGCKKEKEPEPIKDDPNIEDDPNEDEEVIIEKVCFSDDLFKDSSDKLNYKLAKFGIRVCDADYSKSNERRLLEENGFEVLLQNNFDKLDSDKSHTCAYHVAKREFTYNGEKRTLVLVVIRGTNEGEWYSNFDYAKCKSDEAIFADNFLDCANDIMNGMKEEVDKIDNPVFFITGHSRGASTANLLGYLLNKEYKKENVYCYTFATPTTIRKEKIDYKAEDYNNIFNFINASDLVPCLPLGAWGYSRFGVDFYLFNLSTQSGEITSKLIKSLEKLCPTIDRYYNDKVSLKHSGTDEEEGIILFDLMNDLCAALIEDPYDIDLENFEVLKDISSSSDLFQLASSMILMLTNGGKLGMQVLDEHMPQTYEYLLNVVDRVKAN